MPGRKTLCLGVTILFLITRSSCGAARPHARGRGRSSHGWGRRSNCRRRRLSGLFPASLLRHVRAKWSCRLLPGLDDGTWRIRLCSRSPDSPTVHESERAASAGSSSRRRCGLAQPTRETGPDARRSQTGLSIDDDRRSALSRRKPEESRGTLSTSRSGRVRPGLALCSPGPGRSGSRQLQHGRQPASRGRDRSAGLARDRSRHPVDLWRAR